MNQNQNQKNNLIWLGTIVNTHGIKGEVRILSNSNDIDDRFKSGSIIKYIKNNKVYDLIIKSSRKHKNFILVFFENINNINDIEWIKGTKIYCLKEKLLEDEYYLSDLINKKVFDQNNNFIGIVDSILDQNVYDSLVVKLETGISINIPIIDEFKIKFQNDEIKVKIPNGFIN